MSAAIKRLETGTLLACALAVLLALAPAGRAHAAGSELAAGAPEGGALSTQATAYRVWVGGKQVTSANARDVLRDGGSVKYNAKTNTLTLNKANIKKARVGSSGTSIVSSGIIYTFPSGTFTINVKGSNKITTPSVSSNGRVADYAYGISGYSSNKAKLKITGTGSLTVKAGGAALASCGLYVASPATVQGKVKLSCTGTTSTRVSCGIAPVGTTFTIKGSAQVTAKGATGAFYRVPKFSGYTPKVKAGYSSKIIKANKKKPASSTYTKYPYVKITKAASKASSGASSSKKPAKVKLTKIDVLPGQLLVHWNALAKNCTGYQMQVAESSKFPANATRKYALVPKNYEGAYAWGLETGTRYYVRVRAYHTVGGKKIWGAYSNVQSAVAAGNA